jgi:adenylate kinase family enzyme
MLGAEDPVGFAPRRILLAGATGVGKTTLAARIAKRLALPRTELDTLYHGPNWAYLPSFLPDVEALAASPAWVTEWQYDSARPILAAHADLLVWLDLPLPIALGRLTRRTVRRRLRHEELWNGNHEGPLWHYFSGRDHILPWAVRSAREFRETVPALDRESPGLTVVRLRSQREVERWLSRL